ncbi:MAG: phage replication protein [Lactococcus lactis]|nr:hypothetical protein [Chryseobacterium sp.]MDN6030697.1 phage replication protein [Lactococcus plantarum]MDN6079190.1 phage replication protein [Lactococcus lactis]MDN6096115.1 phage replication protein [Lactococcus lactis]MDN6196210.1 phage replication protein [Atopostipes suicloacalis]
MGIDRKSDFLQALLTEPTIEKAASKAQIAKSTAYKYLKDTKFNERLLEKKRELMSQVTNQLQQKAIEAVKVLSDIMTDEKAPEYARISAAKSVLDNAYKGLDLEDIQVRLAKIEEVVTNKK